MLFSFILPHRATLQYTIITRLFTFMARSTIDRVYYVSVLYSFLRFSSLSLFFWYSTLRIHRETQSNHLNIVWKALYSHCVDRRKSVRSMRYTEHPNTPHAIGIVERFAFVFVIRELFSMRLNKSVCVCVWLNQLLFRFKCVDITLFLFLFFFHCRV